MTSDPSAYDWSRLDAMTEAERHAAALADMARRNGLASQGDR
jgi:lambda repressor-like predicted transcriptional regulator